MISLSVPTATTVAIILALWLLVAVLATIRAIQRSAIAIDAVNRSRRLEVLGHGAPALPMAVDQRGRLDLDVRLVDWLGLDSMPRTLDQMSVAGRGLPAAELAGLIEDIAASRLSGGSFVRRVRPQESSRVLMVRGRPGEKADRTELWFFDATDSETEIARLRSETARLGTAIESLSALIEAAPFPMWHRGPDLRLALVNTAYVRAVDGDSAADVVTRGLELVDGAGGRGPLATAAAVRESGRIATRTAPATIDGTRRMIRVVDVPIGNAGVTGYAIDVEELEEARADLGRFARAQRDMLDLLSAGVAQFGPDRSLTFSNQPFARIFGMPPEWLADAPEFDRVLERMRETRKLPESRDFPGWKAERRGWFHATGEPIEENWLLPGGTHLRVLGQPLPDGGLLLIFEDRTEHAQLAKAADTLVRVRTATFDNLFEAVGVFSTDGRLQLWNNRFRDAWGMTEAELALRPRVDTLVEAAARRLAVPARAGLIRELVRIATTERQQRSGRVGFADGRDFDFIAVPLPDGNALFTMLDITDSRRIERALRDRNEALEETDKLKNAFVANMSYELRTPLTSIGGFAEMLAGGYAGEMTETAREYVSAIIVSVSRLGSLIDDVLDLTQVEAGSLPLQDQRVDLHALLDQAAAGMRGQAVACALDFVVNIEPSVGLVQGDPRRLRQTVDHLLRNAIAYTPEGGRVLLQADGDDEAARIVVSDDGPGIPPEDREKIFTKFGRPASRSGDGQAAVGLGLPLSRQFVEAHGGTLTLMSEPDAGTTVVARLPRQR